MDRAGKLVSVQAAGGEGALGCRDRPACFNGDGLARLCGRMREGASPIWGAWRPLLAVDGQRRLAARRIDEAE